ncbi:MAG: hypothetical protein H7329_08370 [Opitutaceae bacterium]|nr:hypothetical protein [Cytophagales bacterium]
MNPNYYSFTLKKRHFLLLFLLISHYCQAYFPGDTIKPVSKINKTFLVSVHLVADSLGNVNDSLSDVIKVLEKVNAVFSPINAKFTVCEFDTISNYNYLFIKDTKDDPQASEIRHLYNKPGRINIFYSAKLTVNNASACGLASLKGITTERGSSVLIVCNSLNTVAHELGHYFGLDHTFRGSGSELANGSNCETEGDFICDTPADPYISSDPIKDYMNDNCKYISKKKDANGQYYNPDPSNIMSYYPCISSQFTKGQYERMVKTYRSNPQAW